MEILDNTGTIARVKERMVNTRDFLAAPICAALVADERERMRAALYGLRLWYAIEVLYARCDRGYVLWERANAWERRVIYLQWRALVKRAALLTAKLEATDREIFRQQCFARRHEEDVAAVAATKAAAEVAIVQYGVMQSGDDQEGISAPTRAAQVSFLDDSASVATRRGTAARSAKKAAFASTDDARA